MIERVQILTLLWRISLFCLIMDRICPYWNNMQMHAWLRVLEYIYSTKTNFISIHYLLKFIQIRATLSLP